MLNYANSTWLLTLICMIRDWILPCSWMPFVLGGVALLLERMPWGIYYSAGCDPWGRTQYCRRLSCNKWIYTQQVGLYG